MNTCALRTSGLPKTGTRSCLGPCRHSRWQQQHFRRHCDRLPTPQAISILDTPEWTLDQIAGLAFGALMAASTAVAIRADTLVARVQRRQLGLCEDCGGLYTPEGCSPANCPCKELDD